MKNLRFSKLMFRPLLLASLGLMASSLQTALAQEVSVKVGESSLTPTLRLDYVSNDNVFNSADNPVESTGLVLSPAIEWSAERRLLKIRGNYLGEFGSFAESGRDYDDHRLSLRIDASPGIRHRTFGVFSVRKATEAFGTGQTAFEESFSGQIERTNVLLEAGYRYGAQSAKGNVGGGVRIGTETYSDLGAITRGDDNTEMTPYAYFSYRLSADTKLFTELSFKVTDYDEDRRDRNEIGFSTGVELAATERSGGAVAVGVSRADYDTEGVSDTSQVISEINLYFRPRSYSELQFKFSRSFVTVDEDDTGPGASLVNKANLDWTHEWTSRFSTLLTTQLSQTERTCPNNDSSTSSVGLEFDVKIRRWLSVGAGINNFSRSATVCDPSIADDAFDSDSTKVGVHLKGTL